MPTVSLGLLLTVLVRFDIEMLDGRCISHISA